jgi:uncharacterized membrane protein YidH (DUF202 family)
MTSPNPGLQPERTLLAWRRTTLGLIANGILLIAAASGRSGSHLWPGVTVVVLALCCWAAVGAVYRRGGPPPEVLGRQAVPWLAGVLVLVVGLFDLVAVLTA